MNDIVGFLFIAALPWCLYLAGITRARRVFKQLEKRSAELEERIAELEECVYDPDDDPDPEEELAGQLPPNVIHIRQQAA